ncbi:hypothetical protein B0H13DRAFT_2039454, partial [Mycena leptocephala]
MLGGILDVHFVAMGMSALPAVPAAAAMLADYVGREARTRAASVRWEWFPPVVLQHHPGTAYEKQEEMGMDVDADIDIKGKVNGEEGLRARAYWSEASGPLPLAASSLSFPPSVFTATASTNTKTEARTSCWPRGPAPVPRSPARGA